MNTKLALRHRNSERSIADGTERSEAYYLEARESERLSGAHGELERLRTLEILARALPSPKTHLILITDLFEGGDAKSMLARAAAIKQSGVNLIVLLALSDSGHPAYEAKHAEAIAGVGCPVFACTPDQFPSKMASALSGKDLQSWASEEDVALIRGS